MYQDVELKLILVIEILAKNLIDELYVLSTY